MSRKPLRDLFDAMLRGKYDFEDFLHSRVDDNYATAVVRDRTVHLPNKKLKAYHRFLNTVLFAHLRVNEAVAYAYRKGVNPHEALQPHAKSRAFFQADIKDFFRSIDRSLIRAKIAIPTPSMPISDLISHTERILDMTTVNDVLAVGFSTSPPISNVCLADFDDELEAFCRSAALVYTRYADDIIVSGQDREMLAGMKKTLGDLLSTHFNGKLELNEGKSKLTTVGRKVKILGLVVLPSGEVAVDMDIKKRIEVLIHYFLRDEEIFLKQAKEADRDAAVEKLSGYVNYINAADAKYLEKLRRKYGAAVIDGFLHRSAH